MSDKEPPPTPEETTPDDGWPDDGGWPDSEPTGPASYAEADPRVLPGDRTTSPPSRDRPDGQDQA